MKENFEADIKDLERKLAEALKNGGGGGFTMADGEHGGAADKNLLFELK